MIHVKSLSVLHQESPSQYFTGCSGGESRSLAMNFNYGTSFFSRIIQLWTRQHPPRKLLLLCSISALQSQIGCVIMWEKSRIFNFTFQCPARQTQTSSSDFEVSFLKEMPDHWRVKLLVFEVWVAALCGWASLMAEQEGKWWNFTQRPSLDNCTQLKQPDLKEDVPHREVIVNFITPTRYYVKIVAIF